MVAVRFPAHSLEEKDRFDTLNEKENYTIKIPENIVMSPFKPVARSDKFGFFGLMQAIVENGYMAQSSSKDCHTEEKK